MSTRPVLGALNRVMPTVLALAGTMLIAFGIGLIYAPAGFIALGVGGWLLEWRYYGDEGPRR